MELKQYIEVLIRRWWILVGVVVIVSLAGYYIYEIKGKNTDPYVSTSIIQVSALALSPVPSNDLTSSQYYASQISDTIADTISSSPVLSTSQFENDVINQISQDKEQIYSKFGSTADLGNWQDPTKIGSALTAQNTHNVISIKSSWNTSAGSWAIANASSEVLTQHLGAYAGYNSEATTNKMAPDQLQIVGNTLSQASNPVKDPQAAQLRKNHFFLSVALSILAGIVLVFFVDYLDDSIYSSRQIKNILGLSVLAEIK